MIHPFPGHRGSTRAETTCRQAGSRVLRPGTPVAQGPGPRAAMSIRPLLAALSLVTVGAIAAACGEEGTTAPESALTELEPDCVECLEALTECTSTSKNEQQFLGCRDLFQACQEKMQLGPDECGRPNNQIACELCREREGHCEGKQCEVEFSVCKTFLMSRDQERCTEDD